VNKIQEDFIYR